MVYDHLKMHPYTKFGVPTSNEGVSVGKIFATMLLPASSDMQHDYSEKDMVWPLNQHLGQGCVCGQNICYHVAASVVSFNLICNMTIFWKSLILDSAPPCKSTQRTRTQAFKLKSCMICFISIAALPACKSSGKNINNCHSYCEI